MKIKTLLIVPKMVSYSMQVIYLLICIAVSVLAASGNISKGWIFCWSPAAIFVFRTLRFCIYGHFECFVCRRLKCGTEKTPEEFNMEVLNGKHVCITCAPKVRKLEATIKGTKIAAEKLVRSVSEVPLKNFRPSQTFKPPKLDVHVPKDVLSLAK